jgi:pyruvate dehydrogenase E1 component
MPPFKHSLFEEFNAGTGDREVSTTMAYVKILSNLMNDKEIGKLIVPIVADEARTLGMDGFFRQFGIYSHPGQLYEPVDSDKLLFYKETTDGQIIEEGLTEAGSLSTFIAAGTAYSNHNINTIPFFGFYSMFGFQRVGDLIWAAADSRCKGFLIGATSGRTTLSGEGLQHQDGNSHLLVYPVPNLMAYDPAFAYELAVIIEDGIKRMYCDGEDIFYYITVLNENYIQPPMPEGVSEGILKGIYKLKTTDIKDDECKVQLLGSGAILNEVIKAQEILMNKYNVSSSVWSVTSYKQLHNDALETERRNRLHPDEEPELSYLEQCMQGVEGPVVAATDYVKAVPESIATWLPGKLATLGTDGFGRSDGRDALRKFFEVNAHNIVLAALYELSKLKKIESSVVTQAIKDLNLETDKPNPLIS